MAVVSDRLSKTVLSYGLGGQGPAKVVPTRKFARTVKVFQVEQQKEKFFTQGNWATYLDGAIFPINTQLRSIPARVES